MRGCTQDIAEIRIASVLERGLKDVMRSGDVPGDRFFGLILHLLDGHKTSGF